MVATQEFVYCLKGKLDFLCDSEWDGDLFCANPLVACQSLVPQAGQRFGNIYQSVKIRVVTQDFGQHNFSLPGRIFKKKRGKVIMRFRCTCFSCGKHTKDYATTGAAVVAARSLIDSERCIKKTWEYA